MRQTIMDVSREIPHVATKPTCYDLINILVTQMQRISHWWTTVYQVI